MREGIVKHSTRYDRPQVAEYDASLAPCLEAQIVDFADEIAYSAHDVDDGLKSGMLDPDDLATVPLWADAQRAVVADAPGASVVVLRYQAVRRLIDWMASDLVETLLALSRERIDSRGGAGGQNCGWWSSPPTTIRRRGRERSSTSAYSHHQDYRMAAEGRPSGALEGLQPEPAAPAARARARRRRRRDGGARRCRLHRRAADRSPRGKTLPGVQAGLS